MHAGVSAAAVENGVTAIFEGPDSEEDYATQNRMIDEAVAAGGRVLVGGERDGTSIAPTVLTDVPAEATAAYLSTVVAPAPRTTRGGKL